MADFAIPPATGRDCVGLVLTRAAELGLGTADYESEVRAYVQFHYVKLLSSAFPWPFARKRPPGVFTTHAEVSAGSAAPSPGSTAVTLSAAPVDPEGASLDVTNWMFFVDGEAVIYRVASHTPGSPVLTLDSAYVGTQGAGSSYRLFQHEYDLASDFLSFQGRDAIRDMNGRYQFEVIGEDEFNLKAGYPWRAGYIPRYGALVGDRRIRIWPWTTTRRRYEYDYNFHPGVLTFDGAPATDTPVITPVEHRMLLVYRALMQVLIDKEDTRATVFAGLGEAMEADMKLHALRSMRVRTWVRPANRISARR